MLCGLYFTCILFVLYFAFVLYFVRVCACHILIKGYLFAGLLTRWQKLKRTTYMAIVYMDPL